MNVKCLWLFILALVLLSCTDEGETDVDWQYYLGGYDRNHYSVLDQITPENVRDLVVAWEYRTGDSGQMQCNPLIIDGNLFMTTALNEVICLDARNGQLKWRFVASEKKSKLVNRGVSYWEDGRDRRIFTTYDDALYGLDFETGEPIKSFGQDGSVSLKAGLGDKAGKKFVTSRTPGTVFQNLIIMPTVVSEGEGAAPGFVQAFDVRTGELQWVFRTIPAPGEFGFDTWPENVLAGGRVGGANNWAGMALDPEHEILYVPTGSASPDFYGGDRIGQNLFANSLIALDVNTGERLWHYQIVHHDIWDRDLPAPPNLVTIHRNGREIEAIAQVTKSGYVYVLDRLNGEPVFPIPEMGTPPSTIPGEQAWPSQPIPQLPKPFSRQSITAAEINPYSRDRDSLLDLWQKSKQPAFTPLSTEPTFILPGSHGGAEWGGAAVDPEGIMYINSNEMAVIFSLRASYRNTDSGLEVTGRGLYQIHCSSCHMTDRKGIPGSEFPALTGIGDRMDRATISGIIEKGKGRMTGFPQLTTMEKERLIDFLFTADGDDGLSVTQKADEVSEIEWKFNGYTRFKDSDGLPGISPPWGTLTAIDLNTGQHKWQIPLGDFTLPDGTRLADSGTPTYGGPLVMANGLLFIASTTDNFFRAFDKKTGELLWKAALPFAGFATPSTYSVDGVQYVTVLCGGGKADAPEGDAVVTYVLRELHR